MVIPYMNAALELPLCSLDAIAGESDSLIAYHFVPKAKAGSATALKNFQPIAQSSLA